MTRPLRILHAPAMVGGVPQALAHAERELGLESVSVSFAQAPYGYRADRVLLRERSGRFAHELSRWHLLATALRRFDVVHFNAGTTIMPRYEHRDKRGPASRLFDVYARALELRDLPLLQAAGKAIFVTFQGDDVRQGDVWRRDFTTTYAREVPTKYFTPESDERKRKAVRRFARYADGIYAATPDLLHVLPARARLLPDVPVDLQDWSPPTSRHVNDRPLVVHAPSDRRVKGTGYVLEAVARLRREGIPFEFQLVEGLTRHDARRLYERADLGVEQLLLGWYSVLAIELMALGKAVVSYIGPETLALAPKEMARELPLIRAHSSSLYDTLKEWLTTRKHELGTVGERSRAYVERWHDPRRVAEELKREYEAALAMRRSGPSGQR